MHVCACVCMCVCARACAYAGRARVHTRDFQGALHRFGDDGNSCQAQLHTPCVVGQGYWCGVAECGMRLVRRGIGWLVGLVIEFLVGWSFGLIDWLVDLWLVGWFGWWFLCLTNAHACTTDGICGSVMMRAGSCSRVKVG